MALSMLRGCSRVSSTFSFTRLFLSERIHWSRPGKTRLPSPAPAAVVAAARPYSSDRDGRRQIQKFVLVRIPSPFVWFRIRMNCFLIRAYFDNEFNIREFTKAAEQAISHVSRLLSQCRFEALEGLVVKDMIAKLEEKCKLLPWNYKRALSAEADEIMRATPEDVGIYYDDDGRKFVRIVMRLWYLTSIHLSDDGLEGTTEGGQEAETKSLLTASYEFQREFTQGVPPDWTITRIEYEKILD